MTTVSQSKNITSTDQALQELVWAVEAKEFSLTFAHCNYTSLQQQLVERLRSLCHVEIHTIFLKPTITTLYTAIQEAIQGKTPAALVVLGLESVIDLPRVLSSANKVREEFRKNFSFPIVVWVNDTVLEQFIQWAPDFKSWVTTTEFVVSTEELLQGMQEETDTLFTTLLNSQTSSTNVAARRWEAHMALQDLHHRGQVLEPDLQASLNFVFGREADSNAEKAFEEAQETSMNRYLEIARQYYQHSLKYWQQVNHLERQGLLLYHLGRNYYRQAEYNETKHRQQDPQRRKNLDCCYSKARDYLHQCLVVFSQACRPDLVAEFIPQLGEVLEHQGNWKALQRLAEKSLVPHQTYADFRRLAQDYSFLANVALHQSRWQDAHEYAQQVLEITHAKVSDDLQLHETGLFLLAQAQQQLGQVAEAISNLEEARQIGKRIQQSGAVQPELNLRILGLLHILYVQQKRYLEAFRIKHAQYSVEQQYGLRAFIGPGRLKSQQVRFTTPETRQSAIIAQEILASGRHQNVQELIARIKEYRYKLTVLYGQSGVGKSSMIEAGLLPALRQETVRGLIIVPILLRNYTHWVEELGTRLSEALQEARIPCSVELNSTQAILEQLKHNEQHHILTVLIFDQFEEFFFICRNRAEQKHFADFFCQCLNASEVKIVLSLREDYLHCLLRYSRELQRTNIQSEVLDNILNQDNLYYVGNLTPEDTQSLIHTLTQRSQAYPADLVEALVKDLETEVGDVRPIELQVVGFQLEEEHITTLAQYLENGSHKMVQRYLDGVVADCGTENQRAAELVLYLLTDENNTRPIKTQAQLETDLQAIAQDLLEETNKLQLVLQLFVEAGIVLLMHESPADRYQLVHDYLVTIIRNQQETKLPQLKLELEKEKNQRQHAEAERDQALQNLHVQNHELKLLNHTLAHQKTGLEKTQRNLIAAAVGLVILTGVAGASALQIRRGEVEIMASHAEALLASNRELDALVESLRALEGSKGLAWMDRFGQNMQNKIRQVLQESVYAVREVNRLESHRGPVRSLSFSPNGKMIATASEDNTVQLWNLENQQTLKLKGHEGSVYSVSFSPDGQTVATASGDHTVRLWCQKCQWSCPYTLKGHQDAVYSVTFSPDGQLLATASADHTVKLWNQDGQFLRTLTGHPTAVRHVSFSPDGQTIATASEDGTIKLWSRDGQALLSFTSPQGVVYSARFSPDGKTIVTAGADGTVRFWNLSGQQLSNFVAHASGVLWASYSSKDQTIATAGADNTVKLWGLDGQLLQTLIGHEEPVYQVSFSPDGRFLATASADTTARLWQPNRHLWEQNSRITALSFSSTDQRIVIAAEDNTVTLWTQNGQYLRSLGDHAVPVRNLRFSPDGQMIATAGEDHTVKLWDQNGTYLRALTGHQGKISSLSFSPDSQLIATASRDGSVKLWNQQGAVLQTLPHSNPVLFVGFSSDSQAITTISEDHTIRRWNQEGTIMKTLAGQDLPQLMNREDAANSPSTSPDPNPRGLTRQDIDFVQISPDGKIMAIVNRVDNTVTLWDIDNDWKVENIKKLKTLEHIKPLADLSFSPNSQLVATAGKDKVVRLWQLQTSEPITFTWHYQGFVEHLAFSPNSNLIALSSTSGRVILWNWQQEIHDLEQLSCERIQGYLQQDSAIDTRQLCGVQSGNPQ